MNMSYLPFVRVNNVEEFNYVVSILEKITGYKCGFKPQDNPKVLGRDSWYNSIDMYSIDCHDRFSHYVSVEAFREWYESGGDTFCFEDEDVAMRRSLRNFVKCN